MTSRRGCFYLISARCASVDTLALGPRDWNLRTRAVCSPLTKTTTPTWIDPSGRISQWVGWHRNAMRNTDVGTARDLSSRDYSVQILFRCPCSPREQSHASAYVRVLKIHNTGSHRPTSFRTHTNTARNGVSCFGLAVRR